jgi:hypothetical protein
MLTVLRMALALLSGSMILVAEVPSSIAIKDAHVVTVSGPDLPKATVLLRNGLIDDVGPNLTIPADAWVIDGTGLTVYPGFISGLSTWGIPQPAPAPPGTNPIAPPATAVKRARGPEDRPQTNSYERAADLVRPSDARLVFARDAGFTTSATFPEKGILGGEGAVIDLAGERPSDMVVASPIGQYVALHTAGPSAGFPNSLMGVIAYVRQCYLDLGWYKTASEMYAAHRSGTKRPGYDHDLEGLAQSPRILLPAVEAQQIDRMLNFGKELKQPFVLYGLAEGYRRIEELRRANIPVLISLRWPEKPKDADPANIPDYRTLVMRDRAPEVPALLAKAGVKFGFYDDGLASAADLEKALKRTLDHGLPRPDAIRALTLSAAEMYGVADRVGSLEKGKIAKVVVTRGDAFEEKTKVEYVFVDGQEFKPYEDKSPAAAVKPVKLAEAGTDSKGTQN